jgi:hypothetical protein
MSLIVKDKKTIDALTTIILKINKYKSDPSICKAFTSVELNILIQLRMDEVSVYICTITNTEEPVLLRMVDNSSKWNPNT